MALDGVSNISLFTSTIGDVNDVEKQLANLQQQISSGLKSQDFKGLGNQVQEYSQMQAKIQGATQYTNSNNLGVSRMQAADTSMQQLESIADNINSLMVQANGANFSDSATFTLQMQGYLQQMADQLNTTFAGQYIFGGTNTADAPVANANYIPVSDGVPDAGYYAGSTQNLTFQADTNITYQFPVRADNIGFQQIFAAAQQAISAFKNNDATGMASARDLLSNGQQNLVSARAQLNSTTVNVQSINTQLSTMQTYWQGLSSDISSTDLVSASTQVSNYEAILQATFQVYSQLSQLRLSDYLH